VSTNFRIIQNSGNIHNSKFYENLLGVALMHADGQTWRSNQSFVATVRQTRL